MENIILISTADLKQKGIFNSGENLVELNDFTFKKGVSFSIEDKEKIVETYKIKSQSNGKYLLVEDKFMLTIWSEVKADLSQSQDNSSQQISSQSINHPEQKNRTKTITRRYRGQTYEVVVPDLSSSEASDHKPEKKYLKYRGKYINS
ncbi:hypothetical protein Xen7305DRAFT_00024160 [Xenococcus sp. PCC 7305]|uniref:hypothetical protein n=1 Tax=Xenococcus sp. PCC 7305 TaxID=102125 RepID=UPI0002ABAFAD|nr:hypothetical protein [Xenococcus sp. PCC 7305]ELS02698.1 hypothetical protein Xen7305DRAFT_00024160 [Xenococcus sp. PCC 7305]